MKMTLATLASLFFIFSIEPAVLAEPYFDQREMGWFWYEPFPPREDVSRYRNPEKQMTVEQIRKRGERLFETALLSPTRENVRAYMKHQKQVLERSEEFAQVWKRVLWESPALDTTVDHPVSAAGGRDIKEP